MNIDNNVKVVAFDADDTLWDCQSHFEQVEERLYEVLKPWTNDGKRELFITESQNMTDLGYGCKAFTLSVIETALRVSQGQIAADTISELLTLGKQLLHLPATPLPGVRETLQQLRDIFQAKGIEASPRMVVFTKGELQDQENKLRRSGLADFFDDVEITSDKTQHEFRQLCEHQGIHPSQLLMVGNSLKSDIAPALAVGAWAIHIPFHVTWQLEQFAVGSGGAVTRVKDFDHERLFKVESFRDILRFF
jgi:putative hydrolase of the HAD superfamily